MFLTVEEAARQLHMGEDAIRRKAAEGSIPARKVGKRWLFHPELLDKFVRGEWHSTSERPGAPGGSDSLYAAKLFAEAPEQQIVSKQKNTKQRSGRGTGGRRS